MNGVEDNNWHYTSDLTHAKAIVTYKNDYHNYSNSAIPQGYTLISFNDFKKYVLKEEIIEPEIIIENLDYLVDLFKQLKLI